MTFLGPDFSAGLRHALYRPFNPAGIWLAFAIFAALLLSNQLILQPALSAVITVLSGGQLADLFDSPRGALLSVLPAGLLTAWLAWGVARHRGADPSKILAMHVPDLGFLGWAIIVSGFLISLFAFFGGLAWLFGLDLSKSGMVEEAVLQIRNDPLFFLVAAGLIIGAPIAEELTFRGQIFAALSQTWMGVFGASVTTSALWAAMHAFALPLIHVGLLFLMGLALCWLLVRFGSLWVTIACHSAWNAIQAYALYTLVPQ